MRILFVCVNDPFSIGGGSQSTRSYLDSILDIYNCQNVDVVVCDEMQAPQKYENVNFIRIKRRSRIKSIIGLCQGELGRFAGAVNHILNQNPTRYDACIFNGGREAGWVLKRHQKRSFKFITIHHNYEVEYCMDTKHFSTLGGRTSHLVKTNERTAYLHSDMNLFLTHQDLETFQREYGVSNAKCRVLGTYDYKDAEIIKNVNTSKDFDFVISGSLVNYQTEHGILHFYKNCFPTVLKFMSDPRVLLTGRNPSNVIKKLVENDAHFEIVPSPIDIHKEVRRACMYVCPTDIGGGLKLRAMDGLKNGLPVLIHSVSARGYDFFHKKPYFKIYTDQEDFERGLVELLDYIKFTNPSHIINKDYYDYFGYSVGTARFRQSLSEFHHPTINS